MPIAVVALVGFTCGWAIGTFLETQVGVSENCHRGLLIFLAFLAGLIVFGIAAGEADHLAGAFEIEDALVEQRWCSVLLWMLAGFALYPFRKTIGVILADLTALALKSPSAERAESKSKERSPAVEVARDGTSIEPSEPTPNPNPNETVTAAHRVDHDPGGTRQPQEAVSDTQTAGTSSSKFLPLSLPWFIEAGIFGAFLVAAVFAFNPRLLSGLTSFKAGYIEAHFTTTGPVIQKGQVAVVDANRKSVLTNWKNFNIYDTARLSIYLKNKGWSKQRLDFAKSYFTKQLHPVFAILYDREYSYLKMTSANFGILQDISTRLSNLIDANVDNNKKEIFTAERQIFVLKKVYQEIFCFRCETASQDRPAECNDKTALDGAACMDTVALVDAESCQSRFSIRYPDFITNIEKRYKSPSETAQNIWEPYIIQAVADLLGRSLGDRERANFLEVTTSFVENDTSFCDPACTFPLPSQMSLVYADVEAKVESEQPWPFDHMFEQVSTLLANTRRIVEATDLSASTRAFGRRDRLIDLSLGLQLFYQRALSGQRFSQEQIQSWLEWLKETRAAMNLLESAGPSGGSYMDDSEKAAWTGAREAVENDPAVVQDAATAAALSSVLLPAQSDGTTGADCLAARSLMDFASNRNLDHFYRALRFDPDEKATYKGLIDQMKARVESECE